MYIGESGLLAMKTIQHYWKFPTKWALLLDQLWADLEHLSDSGAMHIANAELIITDAEHENVTKSYANKYESVVIDILGSDETRYSFTQKMIRLNVNQPMMWQFEEMTIFSNVIIEPVGLTYKEHSDKLKIIIPENVRRHFYPYENF